MGNPAGCVDVQGHLLTADQRGYLRPVDGNGDNVAVCDSGAYEFAEPDFALTATPLSQSLCLPGAATYTISSVSVMGYQLPITLSAPTLPTGATPTFTPNPIIPGESSLLTLEVLPGAPTGPQAITIVGTAPDRTHTTVCTLRAAIQEVNALYDSEPVMILLPAGDFTLTIAGAGEDASARGDLDIIADMSIIGPGADRATIDGNGLVTGDRTFHVLVATQVTIAGLTIRDGDAPDYGGGICNSGVLTVTASTLSGNVARGELLAGGGAIYNRGTMTLDRSVLSGNSSNDRGGGLFNDRAAAVATVTNSYRSAWSGPAARLSLRRRRL